MQKSSCKVPWRFLPWLRTVILFALVVNPDGATMYIGDSTNSQPVDTISAPPTGDGMDVTPTVPAGSTDNHDDNDDDEPGTKRRHV